MQPFGFCRIQPVYVVDVAAAIVNSLKDDGTSMGKTYELGGPEIYTVHELVIIMHNILLCSNERIFKLVGRVFLYKNVLDVTGWADVWDNTWMATVHRCSSSYCKGMNLNNILCWSRQPEYWIVSSFNSYASGCAGYRISKGNAAKQSALSVANPINFQQRSD